MSPPNLCIYVTVRRLSDKLRPASTPRLANKTPTPWCLPNPNPSMGPVPPLPRRLLARLASMLGVHHLVYEGLHSNLVSTIPGQYQWSLMTSSTISDTASLITTASTVLRALRNLCQTGTVSAYTQDFNQHARTVGWANTPLMSLYQHGLKENIQFSVVMSNIEFNSLCTSTPIPNPNRARQVQQNLCFHCGQEGHKSCRCLNGGQRPQDHPQPPSSAQISKLQAKINCLHANPSATVLSLC
ncbi:uncharacterized protein VP01_92g6 [Puccinia sorghi]|uniref:CCHC-type domain-containing protein n=1 Tax=Puccinia sorghi TaxID=27349 RepID=A0A0L6U722_9BASI|nr:uncharacterized protein VP01_92g6 [Puccinia sorghi]